ncbi:hypothetical protein J6590_018593 [Homalodisca vitripennis]|nr:hypothetical protein J6590_018593 [Homalodisca vitripennis]
MKHLYRVVILREDPLCRMCDEQDETAEHLLFDCPAVPRERTTATADSNDPVPGRNRFHSQIRGPRRGDDTTHVSRGVVTRAEEGRGEQLRRSTAGHFLTSGRAKTAQSRKIAGRSDHSAWTVD